MSGLAKEFSKIIKKQLQMHATWLPMSDQFEVGAYGVINNGIFKRLGNIQKKYPDLVLDIQPGKSTSINFTSEGTRTIKLNAEGSEISSLQGLGNANAKLKFAFDHENSCVVKASVSSEELKNIEEVALKLTQKPTWKRNYKIVSKVYTGEQCVLVLASESGTEFELSAGAEILAKVEGGKAEAGISTQFTQKSGLDLVGETGPIALELFKVGGFNPGPIFLKETDGPTFEILEGDLEDDI